MSYNNSVETGPDQSLNPGPITGQASTVTLSKQVSK